jgi:mRNA interferase MazF
MVLAKDIKQFDIYWANLNPTKGSEIKKTRPCIIISPDEMNEVLKTIVVVPLTSTIIEWPFRQTIFLNKHESSAACDQLRTITKERLLEKFGSVPAADRAKLLEILQNMFS